MHSGCWNVAPRGPTRYPKGPTEEYSSSGAPKIPPRMMRAQSHLYIRQARTTSSQETNQQANQQNVGHGRGLGGTRIASVHGIVAGGYQPPKRPGRMSRRMILYIS